MDPTMELDLSNDKRNRIRHNLRMVSPAKKKSRQKLLSRDSSFFRERKRTHSNGQSTSPSDSENSPNQSLNLSRSTTFFEYDKQMVSGDQTKGSHQAFLRRMSTIKSYTMPDLFEPGNFLQVHEENVLRKQFRDAIAKERLHTTPHPAPREKAKGLWKKLEKFPLMIQSKEQYLIDIESKVTEEEKQSVQDARRKSIEESGLWQLASSSMFKQKANRTMHMGDIAMAISTRKVAVERMREKIEKRLDLPQDHFERVATLRNNVKHIERRFRNIVQGSSSETLNSTSIHALQRYEDDGKGDHSPKFLRPGEAMKFFRRYARIVLIILKWIELIMDSSEQNKLERELKSFVDIANEVQEEHVSKTMNEYGLSFDKNHFKAKKEITLTQDHRKTLTTRWNFRSPEMVKQVMHGLQALRSLADYPLSTQEKLCKVAWYQTLGAKKPIVRQGQNAESFYFILSGTAFVKKMVTDPKTGETCLNTVARLTKGQSFGEIGLIFNTKRTATVESSTPMELLVIGKDDFNRIFMNDNQDEEAEHVKFLRQVPMMQNWPVDNLRGEPGTCILHYFKRGTLVSENGKTSEWLYIIKSGSCEVLKKLRNVKARKSGEIRRKTEPMTDIVLPVLGGIPAPRVDAGISRLKQRKFMHPDVYEDMTKYYDLLKRSLTEKSTDDMVEVPDDSFHLPRLRSSSCPGIKNLVSGNEEESVRSVKSVERKVPIVRIGTPCEVPLRIPPINNVKADGNYGVSNSKFNFEKYPCLTQYQAHFMLPTSAMIKAEAPPVKKQEEEGDEECTKKSNVFVKVELLQAKDVFGANTLTGWGSDDIDDAINDAPATCLVSRGAEIVMLSKKVFLKYMNDAVEKHLREIVRPYPLENKMQENFQTKMDWDDYKKTLIVDIVDKQVEKATPVPVV